MRIWQAIREISIYAGFILVLFYVTYTNIGKSAFDYQNAMKNTFVISDEVRSGELIEYEHRMCNKKYEIIVLVVKRVGFVDMADEHGGARP